MTNDNLNQTIEPVNFKKNTSLKTADAHHDALDIKKPKILKSLSMRPTRSVKKGGSLKQAYNKLK